MSVPVGGANLGNGAEEAAPPRVEDEAPVPVVQVMGAGPEKDGLSKKVGGGDLCHVLELAHVGSGSTLKGVCVGVCGRRVLGFYFH